LVLAIPLGLIMGRTVRETTQEQAVFNSLTRELAANEAHLVDLEVVRGGADLLVVATVRSAQPVDVEMADALVDMLREQLDDPVRLELIVLPVIYSGDGSGE
jgi:hypothetical protein